LKRLIEANVLLKNIINKFGCKPFIEVGNTYEYLDKIIAEAQTAFDIDKVLDQIEDYGKYKGVLMCDDEKCERYIPVSMAKQIVRGKGLGGVLGYLEKEIPSTHICDINK